MVGATEGTTGPATPHDISNGPAGLSSGRRGRVLYGMGGGVRKTETEGEIEESGGERGSIVKIMSDGEKDTSGERETDTCLEGAQWRLVLAEGVKRDPKSVSLTAASFQSKNPACPFGTPEPSHTWAPGSSGRCSGTSSVRPLCRPDSQL